MSAQPLVAPGGVRRALPPEEIARANFYALLARLLARAPDNALLHSLGSAAPLPAAGEPALAAAWRGVMDASSVMDAAAAEDEYDALFNGMGKAAVSLYAGFYSGAPAADHPRVKIIAELAALGLARKVATEPEDHIAGLFEVMRLLVAGGAGRAAVDVAAQRRFFRTHVEPGVGKFFAALGQAAAANYYRRVAAFGAAFIALESESFALD